MNNPYKLPEGNVQISFSGGRTSAYMLHQILEANGGLPERAKVVFANTGREAGETLDFVQECGERWNVPITWIEYDCPDGKHWYKVVSHNSAARYGEPFEALIRRYRKLPNTAQRFCTGKLKVENVNKFLRHEIGWRKWGHALGIRADEARRVKPNASPSITNWFPLVEAGVGKLDIKAFWDGQPFDLRLANVNGTTPLGNCDGCFLKSEWNLAYLCRTHPDKIAWWDRMEKLVDEIADYPGSTFRQGQSVSGFRDFIERQGDWIFDMEGALCQADDGECTG